MFEDQIRAWQNGPVTPSLFQKHRSLYPVDRANIDGNPDALTDPQQTTADAVFGFYGKYDGEYLVELTHRGRPWRKAWGSRGPEDSGNDPIPTEEMESYYATFDVPMKTLPDALRRGIDMLMTLPADEVELMDKKTEYDVGEFSQWVQADPGGIEPFD